MGLVSIFNIYGQKGLIGSFNWTLTSHQYKNLEDKNCTAVLEEGEKQLFTRVIFTK